MGHILSLRLLLLSAVAVLACDDKGAPTPSPVVASARGGESAPPSSGIVETVPSIDVQARALLAVWVRTQNEGDYKGYEQLYAEKFYGVKLAGERKARFDRAGWLRDRKAMFERPFTVAISQVTVSGTMKSATVLFEQIWASQGFQDRGQKRLLLVSEGSSATPTLRIAQEEMLTSVGGPSGASIQEPSPLEYSPVRDFAAGKALIVGRGFELGQVVGPLTRVGRNGPRYAVHRPLSLKAEARVGGALLGRRFSLYGAKGEVCSATVIGLAARAEVTPHFGQVSAWNGVEPEGQAATESEIALAVWRESEGSGYFTAAELKAEGDCAGALWARASDLPKPVIYQVQEMKKGAALDAALGARADYRNLMSRAKSADIGVHEIVQSIRRPDTGLEWVHYFASAGGCSDFQGELWVLLQSRPTGPLPLTGPGAVGAAMQGLEPFALDAAFDLEGDGQMELLGGDSLLRTSGHGYVRVRDVSPPYHDCPC